ncbi:MarR family winged helix-turn-helix transcriptional regulator [Microbacterium sp. A196]|uniref:MarR family winged helix-turn-helix transcriptional regulator n=1 Tax=Microbacterium sp. A196 TaxID=3457320 RepID=UPI003FCF7489
MSTTSSAAPDHTDLVRLMLRDLTVTTSILHARADAKLSPIGQNLSRWQAMSWYGSVPSTVPTVARSMDQSRQYIQRITDELANDGYVVANPNPAHRRSPLFSATPEGLVLIDEMEAAVGNWTKHLSDALSEHELHSFRATLAHLRDLAAAFDMHEFQSSVAR